MEPSEKLNVTFAGVRMRSPVGVPTVHIPIGERAALTPELHAEVLLKHAEAGAGFIYIPSCNYITEEMIAELRQRAKPREFSTKPERQRWMKSDAPGSGVESLYSIDAPMTPPPENRLRTFDLIRRITEILRKKRPDGVALIASILPLGDFPETVVISGKKMEELGVDLIELNLSCGYMPGVEGAVEYYLEEQFPLLMVGSLVGDNLDISEKIAAELVKAVNIPVGVKLSPETGYPRIVGLVRRLRDVGVRFVQALNIAPTIAPPDIYNRGKSRWPYVGANPFVAGSGGWLRPALYKDVAGIAKFAPGIDIAASGGLLNPEHAVEVMMLGATLAQFCTGILLKGRKLITESVEFLERYVEEQGYRNVEEFVGLGVQYIESVDKISLDNMVAEVDPVKCRQSGLCTDHICIAMERGEEGKARVNAEACSGCGLCVVTCPGQAIRLVPRR